MERYLIILTAFAADSFGRFWRWLTFRRVLGMVAFIVILVCLRELMAAGTDLSFLFGLDLGLVVEVSALMIILAARDRVKTAAYLTRRSLQRLFAGRLLRRGVGRAWRSRRQKSLLPPPDDEPAQWAFG